MSQFDRGYYTGGVLASLLIATAFGFSSCSSQTAREEAIVIREARALIRHYYVPGDTSWDERKRQFEVDAAPYLPQPSPAPTPLAKTE